MQLNGELLTGVSEAENAEEAAAKLSVSKFVEKFALSMKTILSVLKQRGVPEDESGNEARGVDAAQRALIETAWRTFHTRKTAQGKRTSKISDSVESPVLRSALVEKSSNRTTLPTSEKPTNVHSPEVQLAIDAGLDLEVFMKVRDVLVDALGIDDDEATPQATLAGDLGAESIDYLDILHRLGKVFSVKLPRGEIFPENLAADTNLVTDGKMNAAGLAELRKKVPHANIDKFAKDPKVDNIRELFTVEMVVRYMMKKTGISH